MRGPLAGIDRFPRARLGHAPTPLDPAPGLGAARGVELWIKRDDCTGLAFGGNKVRQLEFHFGEAQARGADTVLVTGAVQSNLVRLAAAGARRLGMEAHVQLEERIIDDAGALYRASGNLLLDRLLGATLRAFPVGEDEAAERMRPSPLSIYIIRHRVSSSLPAFAVLSSPAARAKDPLCRRSARLATRTHPLQRSGGGAKGGHPLRRGAQGEARLCQP